MKMMVRIAAVLFTLLIVTGGLFAAGEEESATADQKLVITLLAWTSRGTTLEPDSG